MKSKKKKFLDMPWASMLVENNERQRNLGYRSKNLAYVIAHNPSISMVVDHAQCWDSTPQGYDYWVRIKRSNTRGL